MARQEAVLLSLCVALAAVFLYFEAYFLLWLVIAAAISTLFRIWRRRAH